MNATTALPLDIGAIQVTDFVLGLKRLCNPVSPVGAPGYYENTIVGMRSYCDGFAKVGQDAASIKDYIQSHDVAGLRAPDARTLVIRLLQPAQCIPVTGMVTASAFMAATASSGSVGRGGGDCGSVTGPALMRVVRSAAQSEISCRG